MEMSSKVIRVIPNRILKVNGLERKSEVEVILI
jgi:hypothetical protein